MKGLRLFGDYAQCACAKGSFLVHSMHAYTRERGYLAPCLYKVYVKRHHWLLLFNEPNLFKAQTLSIYFVSTSGSMLRKFLVGSAWRTRTLTYLL